MIRDVSLIAACGDIIRGVLRSALRVRLYGELVLDDDDDEEGHSTISRPAKSHVI